MIKEKNGKTLVYIGNVNKAIGLSGYLPNLEVVKLREIVRNNCLSRIRLSTDGRPGCDTNVEYKTAVEMLDAIRPGKYDPDKKPRFFAIKEDDGGWTVKTKIGKVYYTVCDTYLIPKLGDAKLIALEIAEMLNERNFKAAGRLTF
jgi:hypothetical protein